MASRTTNTFVEELQAILKRLSDLLVVQGIEEDNNLQFVTEELMAPITRKLWELHGIAPDSPLEQGTPPGIAGVGIPQGGIGGVGGAVTPGPAPSRSPQTMATIPQDQLQNFR